MFTAPRFIAVDDKEAHLSALVSTLQGLGAPCMGIKFDAEKALDSSVFRGVRALFLDLHLIAGVKTTDEKQHYANIASILDDNISEGGGPFVLILWTEHPQHAKSLTEYLDGALDPQKHWTRPLAVLPLAKEDFINVQDGSTKAAGALQAAIEDALGSNPQLSALVSWELDVVRAIGETLSSLTALVPPEDRNTSAFPGALDAVLSRLAVEAVGKKHVPVDPRSAVISALAPILADRIVNQETTPETEELWKKAVTRHGEKTLPAASSNEAGGINRMLHVALVESEKIAASDWGAVSEFPKAMWTDDALTDLVGLNIDQLLREEFKIRPDDHSKCRARLVRVGAVCDHAQKKAGPIPFLFGVEIPAAVERIKINGELRVPAAEWASPMLLLPNLEDPFTLHVSSRFEITRPAAACANWKTVYRLREQLLMQLIAHTTSYVGRPGIVRL